MSQSFKQYKIQRCLYAIGLNTYKVNLKKLAHKDKYGTKDKILLELRPEIKVIVIFKQFVALCKPKMYPHTKYGILTSNNKLNMLRTRFFHNLD